ncbi:hypothetical protein J5N97_005961 [Dioscorea zingiberensis]|uniref:Uncharacterized protein n=1 Tax=Dioscorea zingiberensis TaxID=325984 RepID=A0A9D5D941_9LILI|nr:hypothetical protein J5N97_005961 [Dioscorea zingiberensis]
MANPATVHRVTPPSDKRPPCGPVGHECRNKTHLPLHSPPPPHLRKERLNFGKKLGLLFVGIGVLLQIGLGGFLAFKRWQLKKLEDGTRERRSARRRLRISSSGSSS